MILQYENKILKEDLKEILTIIECKKFKGKSILITGATGMLATYLVYFFYYLNTEKNYNIKVIGLVRNEQKAINMFGDILNEKIKILKKDVTEKLTLEEDIDYIFHLASSANPKSILETPIDIIEANTLGTLNVCKLAVEKKSKVIFSSTREVYGILDNEKTKLEENDIGKIDWLEKRACYPESKRIAETIINSFNLQYGMQYNIIRISHCYGPGMNILNDGRVMSDFISNAIQKNDMILKSLGEDVRSFCYISDAIIGMLQIALNGMENQVYNLSNEKEEIKVKDLAVLINDLSKNNKKILYEIGRDEGAYTNYKRIGLDTSKLEELGWKINVNLKDGILKTLASFNKKGF